MYNVERPIKQPQMQVSPMKSFGNEDCQGVVYLHDDVLVVMILVVNYTTRRILIDNGSSANDMNL